MDAGVADFLSLCCCTGEVFTPYFLTGGAFVSSVTDDQGGRPPAKGRMSQTSSNGISGNTSFSAGEAPGVRAGDFAENFCFHSGEPLTYGGES